MTAQPLSAGSWVDGLQVEQLLASDDRGFTYAVSDPALGTRFMARECFPAQHARRNANGDVEPINGDHQAPLARARDAFLAESRLLAEVDHPNVVRILRNFTARGTSWRLHELPAGRSLAEHLAERGPMAPDDARRVLQALADALEYLHHRGIFHLAITPASILLTERQGPLLSGFRLAAEFKQSGRIGGTHTAGAYTAPELTGPDPEVTPRADLYALAAVMYHCLTGHPPPPAAERTGARGRDPVDQALRPFTTGTYGGLGEAIGAGLRLEAAERPEGMASWRKAFTSIDWRRRVAASAGEQTPTREKPEWLVPMLLGGFLAVLTIATLYLVVGEDPAPDPYSAPSSPPPAVIPTEETERWQAALRADTLLAYRRFMEDYPDSAYVAQARLQLEIIDERRWAELATEDTRAAYRDYLDMFPNGLHETEALQRIEAIDLAQAQAERNRQTRLQQDEAAWRKALDGRSVASMDEYLRSWPAGSHVEEAQQLRRALRARDLEERAWAAAEAMGTREAFQAYLDAYPSGDHAAEALITLEHLQLAPGKAFRDCIDCPAMMVIPAGAFWQGSGPDDRLATASERPQRMVEIARPFAVGIHEVTFAQWDACVAGGGCRPQPMDNGWGRGARPVIMVSWSDAQAYVGWLSEQTGQDYRLPSESEWEYFARAGETGPWLGGTPGALCDYANIAGRETGFQWQAEACGDGHALGTLPAGSRLANAFGLHDVIGNVAEWTADCMNLSYLDAPTDGSAWGRGMCSSHMTRGGSWLTGERETRLAARFNLSNGDRNDFTGFRVVRTVPE